MGRIKLNKGSIVYFEKEAYEILSTVDYKSVRAKNHTTGKQRILQIDQLRDEPEEPADVDRLNTFCDPVDEKRMEVAKWRFSVIERLLSPERIRSDVERVAEEAGVSVMTLYTWIKSYESTGVLSSLIPRYEKRGGKGEHRIGELVDEIITEMLDEKYLKTQKLKVTKLHEEIEDRCKNAGLPVPHINTVRNRINDLPRQLVVAKRHGAKKAKDIYGVIEGKLETNYVLQIVQVDHTPLDIIVVDEIYRKPVGRPFFTAAEDIFSRMVFGFYVSFESPSLFTAGQSLTMGIAPKDSFLRKMEADGEWNIWGLPGTIHVDNALQFTSGNLRHFCEEYHINLEFRPIEGAHYGGHVERFVETVNQEVHSLPGTTFSNIKEKEGYDPEKYASMTIRELEKWITEFIVNKYHKRKHSMIGMPPVKKYYIGVFGDENAPGAGLPEIIQGKDLDRLKKDLLPLVKRTVQRDGVNIDGIKYYADVLRQFVKMEEPGNKKRKLFTFRIDPRDISEVYFYDPNLKEYFSIPYRNVKYPPISVWELEQAKKYLKAQGKDHCKEEEIFEARKRMKAIEDEAVEKTKSVRRRHAAKQHHKQQKGQDTKKANKVAISDSTSNDRQDRTKSAKDDLFSNVKPFAVKVIRTNREDE